MRLHFGLVLAAVPALAQNHEGHHGHHHPMSLRAHAAFLDVENICQQEAEALCRPPEEQQQEQATALMMADPFVQWIMAPPERLAPPPMMVRSALSSEGPLDPRNIGQLIDHMMDTAMSMPLMIQQEEPVHFMFVIENNEEQQQQPPPEVQALDSMVSKLLVHLNGQNEQREQVTHHIRLKGEEIMKQEDVPEDRRRLARRLMEVSPEEMHHHRHHDGDHHHGPLFGCPHKQECIENAQRMGKLSPECSEAVTRLQQLRALPHPDPLTMYLSMVYVYCLLCVALFVMIARRKWGPSKEQLMLRVRILQAVYSNPRIKAKVEDDIGSELGAVPPLPDHALRLMSPGGHGDQDACRGRRIRFYSFLAIMTTLMVLDHKGALPVCWPFFMLGFCSMMIIGRMISLCFMKDATPPRACNCCCCGGSTEDVENGTVSKSQACCKCCKGSGVCAPKCKACCGAGGCDKGCSGDCGCCTNVGNKCNVDAIVYTSPCMSFSGATKTVRTGSEIAVYHGIPVQMV